MANMTFGVNILPKDNTVSIGNSEHPWNINSPNLTGVPAAPTAAAGTNTTQVATTAFVATATGNKADKVTNAVNGNFAALDSNGNLTDSGHKHSDYLTSHQDISGKADKDTDAVVGNFAEFDSAGNPVDSGHKHSDYITSHQDISGKADKVTSATNGNFAALDSSGNLVDSGHSHSDYITEHDIAEYATKEGQGGFPAVGSTGKIYIAEDTNIIYRWDDTLDEYVSISSAGGGSALRKITFSIATTDWTAVTGGYSASITDPLISDASEEFIVYNSTLTNLTGNLADSKNANTHSIVLTTSSVPSGTITGTVYSIINDNGSIAIAMIDDVLGINHGGTNATTAAGARNNLGAEAKSNIAFVENTATATNAITKGYYVNWQGEAKKASAAISVGDTLSSSNLTSVSNGIANDLQAQVDTINARIGNIEQPASVFSDIQFSIAVSDWAGASAPYTATVVNSAIASTSGIWVFYDASYHNYAAEPISAYKTSGGGSATFSSNAKPTGTITGYIRIVDSVNGVVPVNRGGTGATDAAGIRTAAGLGSAAVTNVANNLTTTAEGYVLDARQGKAISDQIGALIPFPTSFTQTLVKYSTTANATYTTTEAGWYYIVCNTISLEHGFSINEMNVAYIPNYLFPCPAGKTITVKGTSSYATNLYKIG